ncbi:hypothetical protein [Cellulomonas cellasea]|uniref:Uncharacterized protein n=1 Tax=Cellulomonas cellasea TaxID=43670 RepID=A0A7W4UDN5_9CELL|nr:hypothetical protein [Cellulomonas cellasea]MBB2922244.1 hypothetical protein [Cellulomonas cellasea]
MDRGPDELQLGAGGDGRVAVDTDADEGAAAAVDEQVGVDPLPHHRAVPVGGEVAAPDGRHLGRRATAA